MTRTALVIGAGGPVGEAAAATLARDGWRVTASLRRPRADVEARLAAMGAAVVFHDLPNDAAWAALADGRDAVVFAIHLEVAAAALAGAAPASLRFPATMSLPTPRRRAIGPWRRQRRLCARASRTQRSCARR